MQFKFLAPLILLATVARAAPRALKRADAITDIQILNYALTLEHLENAFYSEALSRFSEQDFNGAGLNRSLFLQISQHEQTHVQFLETALGDQATKACNYSFPYSDIKGFSSLSMMLEGVGVTAYLGAAAFITNKQYLTAAGSILTTESRHNAWVSSVADGQTPWSGSFDTPMDFDQVFSLASAFITSCPASNPTLPIKAFPPLNISTQSYTAGSDIALAFDTSHTDASKSLFVAFLYGLTPTFVPYDATSKKTTIPANVTGTAYAIVTTAQNITDESTVAGPAILMVGGTPVQADVKPTASATSPSPSNGSGTANSKNGADRRVSSALCLAAGVSMVSFVLML